MVRQIGHIGSLAHRGFAAVDLENGAIGTCCLIKVVFFGTEDQEEHLRDTMQLKKWCKCPTCLCLLKLLLVA